MHRSQFCGIGGARQRARRCSLARALGVGGRTILGNRRSDMCFELGAQRMHRSQFAESARRCSRLEVLGGARALEVVAGAGKRSQHPNYSVSGFVYHPGSMKNSILWYTTSLFRLSPIIKASPLPYKPPTPRLPTMGIQLERGHGPRRCRLLNHRIYRKLDQATSDNDTWLVRNQRKSLLAQHSAIIARRNWLILTKHVDAEEMRHPHQHPYSNDIIPRRHTQ